MRTPIRPLPAAVRLWTRRARWLRRLDGVAAWACLWAGTTLLVRDADTAALGVLAAVLTAAGAAVPPVRRHWRPLTGLAALVISQPLRAGHAAWHVGPEGAERVLVTARRGLRVVITRPGVDAAEGIPVRRCRVLLLPASPR